MPLTISDWQSLDRGQQAALLRRPALAAHAALAQEVAAIIAEVRSGGDAALAALSRRYDHVALDSFAVTPPEFDSALRALTVTERAALERAIAIVHRFHAAQRQPPLSVETAPGVRCERLELPLKAIGIYTPAGSAPLPSATIMAAVPAAIAGCPLRILCTPPRPDGSAHPAVLYAAARCGVSQVFKVGGAQAIAALAYGTESIPKVDKIFGPGNAWVTAAKLQVAADPDGAAFDLPAGPSEVLVIADESARAEFVAADLLAQAEHDRASQVMLVTTSAELAARVVAVIERELKRLTRREIASAALGASRAIVVPELATAFAISNAYAPEHLILQIAEPRAWLARVEAAGSVFLGEWSPEAVGDYCSGANHVLPTYGYARAWSGLGLGDFMRRVTVQELTPAGLADLGAVAVTLAGIEGLDAHARSIEVRLAALAAA